MEVENNVDEENDVHDRVDDLLHGKVGLSGEYYLVREPLNV